MDGYIFKELKSLLEKHNSYTKEIDDLNDQMKSMPEFPKSIDAWIDSVPDLNSKGFKLSDFKKSFIIHKKYTELTENRDANLKKLKIAVIDDLISQINNVLKK